MPLGLTDVDTVVISFSTMGIEYPSSYFGKLTAHDGWGMAPLHRLDERGPMQNGVTDLGYRLDPRYGRFMFNTGARTLQDMYDVRQLFLDIFRPSNSIKVQFTIGTVIRNIDCKYDGDMSLPWGSGSWGAQNLVLSLKAEDPTFYDPIAQSMTFAVVGGTDESEIPMPVPSLVGIGASTVNLHVNMTNNGNADTYPIIRLTGPMHDFVLTNVSTGDTLDFTGDTIAGAHYYDIDLRYGYKTVIDNHGVNQVSKLTEASDLVSFHLGVSPEVVGGVNDVMISALNMDEFSHIEFVWNDRYLGV